MAVGIPQAFTQFRQNLEITGLQGTTVSTRQKAVRDVMEAGMKVQDSFLTGSYQRSTMIAPLSEADIDIFFVLDPSYFHHYNNQNGGPAGLLDWVKRTLLKTYTSTPDISRNGQAVTIRFTDFTVDVVPGFNRQGGGYLIPNSIRQSWLSTDPKKHVELVSASNTAHNGSLVPLIKMLKCWNRAHSKFFRSFHLEVLALKVLQNVTITDFPSGARFFFDKARPLISVQVSDPAGYGDDIGSYIIGQEKINEAVGKLQRAFERAAKAEQFAAVGNGRAAIDMWRINFGDYFPAYG
jgi:hypothetical protein